MRTLILVEAPHLGKANWTAASNGELDMSSTLVGNSLCLIPWHWLAQACPWEKLGEPGCVSPGTQPHLYLACTLLRRTPFSPQRRAPPFPTPKGVPRRGEREWRRELARPSQATLFVKSFHRGTPNFPSSLPIRCKFQRRLLNGRSPVGFLTTKSSRPRRSLHLPLPS